MCPAQRVAGRDQLRSVTGYSYTWTWYILRRDVFRFLQSMLGRQTTLQSQKIQELAFGPSRRFFGSFKKGRPINPLFSMIKSLTDARSPR